MPECPDCDHHEGNEDEKSLSEADEQKDEDEAVTAPLADCTPAAPSPPPTIVKEMEDVPQTGFQ